MKTLTGLMLDMDVDIREMLDDDFDDYDGVENFNEVENDDCELGEIFDVLKDDDEVSVCFCCFFFDIFLLTVFKTH